MKYTLILLLTFAATSARAQSEAYQQEKARKMAMKSPFEKIWDGELPAEIVYKDEEIIAFVPLSRQTPVHYLIVPKKRIPTLNDLTEEDIPLLGKMHIIARDLAITYGIDKTGYRVAINTHEDSGQSVFHLHMHLMGGIKTGPMVDQTWRNAERSKKGND